MTTNQSYIIQKGIKFGLVPFNLENQKYGDHK